MGGATYECGRFLRDLCGCICCCRCIFCMILRSLFLSEEIWDLSACVCVRERESSDSILCSLFNLVAHLPYEQPVMCCIIFDAVIKIYPQLQKGFFSIIHSIYLLHLKIHLLQRLMFLLVRTQKLNNQSRRSNYTKKVFRIHLL